jgi:glutamyl-tRNA(Gln) amidotransferase subunit E
MNFSKIGLKVGLEVHQQLATPTKLFCACPPYTGDETDISFKDASHFSRILRPASSELGEIDEAARFESRKEIRVTYVAPKNASCLVDADEEPPHPISNDALETSLIFALALKSRIIDEIHVMRKIVVDGSNTSGFQRTAAVALGGTVHFGEGKSVGVQSISVEEDAARPAKEDGRGDSSERSYILDRLGTPLVEVALAPIEGTPADVETAARTLGRLMRSTWRVARGLGTIRQDLNISIRGGHVIEVKGVQRLEQFRKVVTYEAARQKFFSDLANELSEKIGRNLEIHETDATSIFVTTKSGILKKALSSSSSLVKCLIVKHFTGFLGKENEFQSRLGKELGSIARTYGLGGIFHSDELPNYGVTEEEIRALRDREKMDQDDAFVLIAGPKQKVETATIALIARLQAALLGVPAETRSATLEGETSFLRPRPGAARMYPETDIPLIEVFEETVARLAKEVPEPWERQVMNFSEKYVLPPQLGEALFDSDRKELFELAVTKTKLSPKIIAATLSEQLVSLSRSGLPVNTLKDEDLFSIFVALDQGNFAKEAVPEILRRYMENPGSTVQEAIAKSGLKSITTEELEKIVGDVIMQNAELIKTRGALASGRILMGTVMQQVRGKADGKVVSETLSKRLSEFEKGKS